MQRVHLLPRVFCPNKTFFWNEAAQWYDMTRRQTFKSEREREAGERKGSECSTELAAALSTPPAANLHSAREITCSLTC